MAFTLQAIYETNAVTALREARALDQTVSGLGRSAAALLMISIPQVMPMLARALGVVAAVLFAATSLQIFSGRSLTPLSEPLPFLAYPVFVLTLFTWAWWCRSTAARS